MRRLVPLLAALAIAGATAPAAIADRIVGGSPATRGYEYAAALRVTFDEGVARCGGAVISARFVVTAAHCLATDDAQEPERIEVALGNVDYDSAAYMDVPMSGYERHPAFRPDRGPGGGHDVALVELPRPAGGEQARLLRPAEGAMWAPGTTATVIGWGQTDDGSSPSSSLLEVQVPVYSDGECASDFQAAGAPSDFFDATTMLCAGGREGRDSCHGDSGGPLLVPDGPRLALAGLVSFGAVLDDGSSCAEELPGVYTRLGAEALSAFVRERVPLVEIELEPALPRAHEPVRLAAVASPAGRLLYGRFDWDLDDDGQFDDATGTTATHDFGPGTRTVAVRGQRGNEAEVRRIAFDVAVVEEPSAAGDGRPVVELATRRARVRNGAFWLRYSTASPGRVVARVRDAATGRELGRATRRNAPAGQLASRIHLNRAGRRLMSARRTLSVRIALDVYDGAARLAGDRARVTLVG